jgi:hypothetical protein
VEYLRDTNVNGCGVVVTKLTSKTYKRSKLPILGEIPMLKEYSVVHMLVTAMLPFIATSLAPRFSTLGATTLKDVPKFYCRKVHFSV